nr:hypothetical protein Iba_chr11eCG9570 [Ipomoea batatas]
MKSTQEVRWFKLGRSSVRLSRCRPWESSGIRIAQREQPWMTMATAWGRTTQLTSELVIANQQPCQISSCPQTMRNCTRKIVPLNPDPSQGVAILKGFRNTSASKLLIFPGILPIKFASFIQRCLSFFNWVKLGGISCAGMPPTNQFAVRLRASSRGESLLISSGRDDATEAVKRKVISGQLQWSDDEVQWEMFAGFEKCFFKSRRIDLSEMMLLGWDSPYKRKVKMKSEVSILGNDFVV